MKNLIGPPVVGEDFLFREAELEQARTWLRNGNSIKLFALRRVGKTSFLRELERRWNADASVGQATYIDIQAERRPSALFHAIFTHLGPEMLERVKMHAAGAPESILNGLMQSVASVQIGGAATIDLEQGVLDHWEPITNAIERILAERGQQQSPIFLDELPFFVENMAAEGHSNAVIGRVLATLRRLRLAGLPMVICGSIGIESVIAVHDIDQNVMNDMMSLEMPLLNGAEIDELLSALVQTLKLDSWTDETAQALKARLPDGVPYFYQYAVSFLARHCDGTAASVNSTFSGYIYNGLVTDFAVQFSNRLKRYSNAERRRAGNLLSGIADAPDHEMPRAEARNMLAEGEDDGRLLMTRLIGDGFLRRVNEGAHVRFTLEFLRNWWASQ